MASSAAASSAVGSNVFLSLRHAKSYPQCRSEGFKADFCGMRSANRLDSIGLRCNTSFRDQLRHARSPSRISCVNTSLVITLSTGALLFLGRFVFLPFQREQVAKAGLPKQNGVTHFEAGDNRAQEVEGLLKTNDPAGFTIVDVLAWGALGHAAGFLILATSSNGYEPQF